MIPVANPIPEPPDFDADCRIRGLVWRAARTLADEIPKTSKYRNFWARYENHLAQAFHQRCGWGAMWIAEGDVEHFLSKKNRPDLIYEWSNYRYISGSLNGSKGNHDDKVLDPFEVRDGWFEVILPSMQLIVTDQVPTDLRDKACFTVKQLRLRDRTKLMRSRRKWYDQYKQGKLTLAGLEDFAPLVAKAVKKLQATGVPLP
jgi:hypothetical protein